MTDHVEGRIAGVRGRMLYWQGWTAQEPARGVVVIVHGLHEHGGRYAWAGQQLAAAGFPAYAIDHAGHGRSDGVPGQIGRMSQVVDGVDALVTEAGRRHPGVPRFMLGHSLGSLIALQYLTGNPQQMHGLITSGCALVPTVVSPAERVLAKLLSAVLPGLPITPLDSAQVSRDPAVVDYHRTNALMVHSKIRARTGAEALATVDALPAQLGRLRLPLLAMAGSADALADPAGSRLLAEKAGSTDKTLIIYDGLYHEILNEPEKQAVLDDIVTWLEKHR
jgi:acylglycerol lipase